jgi:lysozyme family protein
MTKRFKDKIIPFLFKWEGTKLDLHPDDPGNYVNGTLVGTRYGIDARSHPKENIANMTAERASDIYWNEYWIKYGCDHLQSPYDWVFFDTCVNCGFGRALKLEKIAGKNPRKFLDERDDFYADLVERRPASRKFLKGWLNRTADLRKHAFA